MTDPTTAYAKRIVKAPEKAGPQHVAACQRHLDDLDSQKKKHLRWEPKQAARACEFVSLLRHVKGEWANQPVTLQPWQSFIVSSLFGWRNAETGLRRFRTAFVEVPRGNGKSTLVAGLALYMAFFDDEPGAEVYAAATKQDQARIVFDVARHMVRRSPGLLKRLTVQGVWECGADLDSGLISCVCFTVSEDLALVVYEDAGSRLVVWGLINQPHVAGPGVLGALEVLPAGESIPEVIAAVYHDYRTNPDGAEIELFGFNGVDRKLEALFTAYQGTTLKLRLRGDLGVFELVATPEASTCIRTHPTPLSGIQ